MTPTTRKARVGRRGRITARRSASDRPRAGARGVHTRALALLATLVALGLAWSTLAFASDTQPAPFLMAAVVAEEPEPRGAGIDPIRTDDGLDDPYEGAVAEELRSAAHRSANDVAVELRSRDAGEHPARGPPRP